MLDPIRIDSKTFLRQHFKLPALPEVVSQLQKVVQRDNVDLREVGNLISVEPSILAQVLKVVNSAYFGLPQEITKVRTAIAYLGLNEVYRISLALSVINGLAIKNKTELDAFWRHSFYTALCAKHIARNCAPTYSLDILWPPAMLHDIGKLVYLKFFPTHYKALVTYRAQHGCLFSEAEQELGLPESSYFGSLLCNHWKLPLAVADACECHTLEHLYDIQDHDSGSHLRRIICAANLLAVLFDGGLGDKTKKNVVDGVKRQLDWDESEFLLNAGVMSELKDQIEDFLEQHGGCLSDSGSA